jgi:hypothetical protein
MGVSTGRKKTLVKSQNSPLSTNVVQPSLGTVEVEGTTSGAAPTSKTRTKFKESHVPYNLFCPLKLNLGDLKQKQNT